VQYRHRRDELVFTWCLVPRIEWLYIAADDPEPHWVSRGACDHIGLIKVIENETAVASARDLYALRSSPQGRMSPRTPQSDEELRSGGAT
jgi:hypothetical protein